MIRTRHVTVHTADGPAIDAPAYPPRIDDPQDPEEPDGAGDAGSSSEPDDWPADWPDD